MTQVVRAPAPLTEVVVTSPTTATVRVALTGPQGPAGPPGGVAVQESSTEPEPAGIGALWIVTTPMEEH